MRLQEGNFERISNAKGGQGFIDPHLWNYGIGGIRGSRRFKRIPLLRIGIKDTFCESGSNEELCEKYGLSKEAIVAAAKKVLERKSGIRKGVTDSKRASERVSSDTINQKGGGLR